MKPGPGKSPISVLGPLADGDRNVRSMPGLGRQLALILLLLAALVVATGAWIGLAEVERHTSAPAEVRPEGGTFPVFHPEGGRVVGLLVAEGDRVAEGDPLIRLDDAVPAAERHRLERDRERRVVEVRRLHAERDGTEPDFSGLDVSDGAIALQRALFESRREARRSELAALDARLDEQARDGEAAAARVDRLQNSITMHRQELDAISGLADRGHFPTLDRHRMRRNLRENEGKLAEAQADRAAILSRRTLLEAERREVAGRHGRELMEELEAAERALDAVTSDLAAGSEVEAERTVRAPMDGVVHAIALAGPGARLAPMSPALELVPDDRDLVVEAAVSAADIRHIRPDQEARVKVDGFDFLDFGTLSGRVVGIAPDTTDDADEALPGYRVNLQVAADELPLVTLRAGMTAEVDFELGRRTVAAYLGERIARIRDGALTEP